MQTLNQIIIFFNHSSGLQALLAALLAYGLAKLISHLVPTALHHLFHWLKWADNEKFIALFPNPIFYTVLLLGFSFAVSLLALNENLEFILLASLRSFLIVVLSFFMLSLTKLLLQMAANNPKIIPIIQEQTLPLFNNLVIVLFILGMVYLIFTAWNVNMSALLASAGIVGLAVGMAARDTLSDVISGVLILTDSPYRVGDMVILEDGTRGRVIDIGIRSTRILTIENFDVTIPNAKIGNSKIVNESSNPLPSRMIAVDILFAYETDMDVVADAMTQVARQHPNVLEKPACVMKVVGLDRERVHCRLLAWIGAKDNRYLVEFALNEAIYKHFTGLGIAIFEPRENIVYVQEFPQQAQEIHIKEMPSVFGKPSLGHATNTSNLPKMQPAPARDRVDELLKNRAHPPAKPQSSTRPATSRPPPLKAKKTAAPAGGDTVRRGGNGDSDDADMMLDMDGE